MRLRCLWLIWSLDAAPFNGRRFYPSEQNQLLPLPKCSLPQSWVTAPFSALGERELHGVLVEDAGTQLVGKLRKGLGLLQSQHVPWHNPLESSKWDRGNSKHMLVTAVQVLHPLQHHPSFMPECTKYRLSRWVVGGRYLTHQPFIPSCSCGSG